MLQLIKKQRFSIDSGQDYLYFGEMNEGKREGIGIEIREGYLFEGHWMNGKKIKGYERTELGLWFSPKGDSYMGEWKHGAVEGEGVHKTSAGQRYQGGFKNFLKHGWGKETFPNRDKF